MLRYRLSRVGGIVASVLVPVSAALADDPVTLTSVTTQAKTDILAALWTVVPVAFSLMAIFMGVKLAVRYLKRAAK